MEFTTVATITRKTKEYKKGLTQNVERARGEMLVHVLGKVKRAFFVRAQFEIIEFIKFIY